MKDKKHVVLLADFAREKPNWESVKAEAMFRKFMNGEFSYDELSNHPDYPVYASAQVLASILPLIIEEMFVRKDTGNFLIYHVISAIDPFGQDDQDVTDRAKEVISLIDKPTEEKICKLLTIIQKSPPIPAEHLDKLVMYWRDKATRPE